MARIARPRKEVAKEVEVDVSSPTLEDSSTQSMCVGRRRAPEACQRSQYDLQRMMTFT